MPYQRYSDHLKNRFQTPVRKISVDAGFTCPNRDGNVGRGGCSFCNNQSFTPINARKTKTIQQQISLGIQSFHRKEYQNDTQFLAYFQAFTNTYAPISILRQRYLEALSHPEIIGIVIGTRPDCLEDEVLDLLEELGKNYSVTLEIGIETTNDRTLRRIRRGHTYSQVVDAFQRAQGRGLDLGGHLIIGLPGETREDFYDHAQLVSELPLNILKIHQLQIIQGTQLAQDYLNNRTDFHLFEKDQYVDFICDFISRLRPNIIIERISSQSPSDLLIAPRWGAYTNNTLMQQMTSRMINRNIEQGDLYGV